MNKNRYLHNYISDDLNKKMIFIGGPRQVGKTTLAKMVSEKFASSFYLNWDSREQRNIILNQKWGKDTDLLIFDEIHKYPKWKSHIKGIWDTRQNNEKIIVTGSSRLDTYRRGSDSLLGRYHYFRLHPFSFAEINNNKKKFKYIENPPELKFSSKGVNINELLDFGGFPEPLLINSKQDLKRWQNERLERIFREDIRDTENLLNLDKVELLSYLLPKKIGSPLSIASLVNDVEATPATIKKWIELLCRNYYIFKVPPYHKKLERALKKEAKYYLWDWSEVDEKGLRFENMIASHLLKYCHFYHDAFGINTELFYLRDREKREVDFLVLWEKKPWFLVESKLDDNGQYTSINYFADKLGIDQKYIVTYSEDHDYYNKKNNVCIIPVSKFLMALI